jgi:hypothetical protein
MGAPSADGIIGGVIVIWSGPLDRHPEEEVTMKVIRHYRPDEEAQLRALLLLLRQGDQPQQSDSKISVSKEPGSPPDNPLIESDDFQAAGKEHDERGCSS